MEKYKLKPNHDKKRGSGQHCGIDFKFGLNKVIIHLQKNQVHKVNVLHCAFRNWKYFLLRSI